MYTVQMVSTLLYYLKAVFLGSFYHRKGRWGTHSKNSVGASRFWMPGPAQRSDMRSRLLDDRLNSIPGKSSLGYKCKCQLSSLLKDFWVMKPDMDGSLHKTFQFILVVLCCWLWKLLLWTSSLRNSILSSTLF